MATMKNMHDLVWEREFEIADTEAEMRRDRVERIRRRAALRGAPGKAGNGLPSPNLPMDQREVSVVAAEVPDMTRHGHTRLRQRGIAMSDVLTIIAHGLEQRSHGATRYFLDRAARACLAVQMPVALRAFPKLDIQVVLSDNGALITAAHRTKRIRRDIQKKSRRSFSD